MVAVKAHQAEAFLKSLERVPPAVLFYGTDAGLVSERAAMLARRLAERDGGEVLRIDDADLENDPARISIELQTVAMFGGRKVVRALAGRRVNADALKPLVEGGNIEGFLIVEAGNLRPDEALRALFEKSAGAAAVACFPDEVARSRCDGGRDAARRRAADRTGGQAAAADAAGRRSRAVACGGGEADAVCARQDHASRKPTWKPRWAMPRSWRWTASCWPQARAAAPKRCRSATAVVAAGESAQGVIAALQRHFLRLHRLRSGYDAGRSIDDVMRSLRPPPHFKQKAALEQQCRDWTLARLNAALAQDRRDRAGRAAEQRDGEHAGGASAAGAGSAGAGEEDVACASLRSSVNRRSDRASA